MRKLDKKTDWLAWSLHYLFGLFIGGVAGFGMLNERTGHAWQCTSMILPLLIGTALIGGGIVSIYGDRLWVGRTTYQAMKVGIVGRVTSLVSIVSGMISLLTIVIARL